MGSLPVNTLLEPGAFTARPSPPISLPYSLCSDPGQIERRAGPAPRWNRQGRGGTGAGGGTCRGAKPPLQTALLVPSDFAEACSAFKTFNTAAEGSSTPGAARRHAGGPCTASLAQLCCPPIMHSHGRANMRYYACKCKLFLVDSRCRWKEPCSCAVELATCCICSQPATVPCRLGLAACRTIPVSVLTESEQAALNHPVNTQWKDALVNIDPTRQTPASGGRLAGCPAPALPFDIRVACAAWW